MIEAKYQCLISNIVETISIPSRTPIIKVNKLLDLFELLVGVDESSFFAVCAEQHQFTLSTIPSDIQLGYTRCGSLDDSPTSGCVNSDLDTLKVDGFNVSTVVTDLERYFRWFGQIHAIYIIGLQRAVFKMEPYAVANILRSANHDVPIPREVVQYDIIDSNNFISSPTCLRFIVSNISASFPGY